MKLLQFLFVVMMVTLFSCSEENILNPDIPRFSIDELNDMLLNMSHDDFVSQYSNSYTFPEENRESIKAYLKEYCYGKPFFTSFRFADGKCDYIYFNNKEEEPQIIKFLSIAEILYNNNSGKRECDLDVAYVTPAGRGDSGEYFRFDTFLQMRNFISKTYKKDLGYSFTPHIIISLKWYNNDELKDISWEFTYVETPEEDSYIRLEIKPETDMH